MDIDFKDEKNTESSTLSEVVESNTELKNLLVEYAGEKQSPEDGLVTVAMIVDTVAEEFPEFLLAVAEENWIRGYQQALCDLEATSEKKDEQQSS